MSNEGRNAGNLRRAFNAAAESFPASVSAYLERTPMGREERDKLMAWWNRFYEAMRDSTDGLQALSESH